MATKIELRSILATPITHKLSSRPKKLNQKNLSLHQDLWSIQWITKNKKRSQVPFMVAVLSTKVTVLKIYQRDNILKILSHTYLIWQTIFKNMTNGKSSWSWNLNSCHQQTVMRMLHTKCDSVVIMIDKDTYDIIQQLSDSLLNRYKKKVWKNL